MLLQNTGAKCFKLRKLTSTLSSMAPNYRPLGLSRLLGRGSRGSSGPWDPGAWVPVDVVVNHGEISRINMLGTEDLAVESSKDH